MKYTQVFVDAIGYELAPVVVTSQELEEKLQPLFEALRLPPGQLEALTGIVERRWWPPGHCLAEGAAAAARKALTAAGVAAAAVEVLIYAGVCREQFEPATACHVAAALGVSPDAAVYDLSNACLGVLNGILDVANRIELGQCRAGLIVSCETAREINEAMIARLLQGRDMELYKTALATLTGGSGAAAVLVTDGSFGLCRWGLEAVRPLTWAQVMATDAAAVLRHGVELGTRTWQHFLAALGWAREQVDRIICHQVGSGHREAILQAIGIAPERDFTTYEYLGNIGTVSLPLSAALAEEREFLRRGNRVGFLGIGSGLNCLMLGLEW
jgi:3-oxoacyl-[acyl-carrier-protein] synthase-3